MNENFWRPCDGRPETPKTRYVSHCEHCGLFSQMWLPVTFPQGGTVECIGCAHLIQAFDLDVGSPGLKIQWKSRSPRLQASAVPQPPARLDRCADHDARRAPRPLVAGDDHLVLRQSRLQHGVCVSGGAREIRGGGAHLVDLARGGFDEAASRSAAAASCMPAPAPGTDRVA